MKIPRLRYQRTKNITEATWQDILWSASSNLTSTDGLIDSLKQRERLALYYSKGAIIGCATIDIRSEVFEGRKTCCIYTGNTWIRKDWRNANLIQLLAFISMIKAKTHYPRHALFWFFGSNNYMSYRLLYRNFETFWPHPNIPTPTWHKQYMQHLGVVYYGEDLDKDTLIWRQENTRSFKDEDIALDECQLQDPFIQYYLSINPRYTQGDRLMCMAPLNLKSVSNVAKLAFLRHFKFR